MVPIAEVKVGDVLARSPSGLPWYDNQTFLVRGIRLPKVGSGLVFETSRIINGVTSERVQGMHFYHRDSVGIYAAPDSEANPA